MQSFLSRSTVLDLIRTAGGKIFRIDFVKKDGSDRKMICRTGVKRHVTGAGMSWDPEARGYVVVFDCQKRQYRMVNAGTVRYFQCGPVQARVKTKYRQLEFSYAS